MTATLRPIMRADRLSARHLGQQITVDGRECPTLGEPVPGPSSEWSGTLLALSLYPDGILAVLDVEGARTAVLCDWPDRPAPSRPCPSTAAGSPCTLDPATQPGCCQYSEEDPRA